MINGALGKEKTRTIIISRGAITIAYYLDCTDP
jgi:hypothetical protein